MESLIRQTRVRFSDAGPSNKDEGSNIRNQRLPAQKTVSFKGEKKKQQNWFQRQLSGQMSKEYDPNNGGEYSAAIAAAAFAVKALEELNIKEQKKIIEEHKKTFRQIKSRTADTRVQDAGKISRRFSAEPSTRKEDTPEKSVPTIATGDTKIPEKAAGPASFIKKASTLAEKQPNIKSAEPSTRKVDTTEKAVPAIATGDAKIPEKAAAGPAPFIKKASTFAEKQPNTPTIKKPETVSTKPDLSYTEKPILPSTNFGTQSSKPGLEETEADAWEKAELAKIKERYQKLGITIGDWEDKKKEKAKRKKDRIESELELRRAKALKHHRTEMERINQIAAGARSQAEENRRNEEFKVKEKANRIRITGKIPATCLCL